MQRKLVLFGCGGHARSVADVLLTINPALNIVFVDESAKKDEAILGFPVVTSYVITTEDVFPASGNAKVRKQIIETYKDKVVNVISPFAYVGKAVTLGKGIFIAHNAHVGVSSVVEDGVIVNTHASIDHEVYIGEYTHIAPNSTVCGRVRIGKNSLLGASTTIIDKITVTENAIVGAGAVVVNNIEEYGTYVGCPARRIK